MKTSTGLLLLSALLSACTGSSEAYCTTAGCSDSVWLTFDPPTYDGQYTLQMGPVGGTLTSCDFEVIGGAPTSDCDLSIRTDGDVFDATLTEAPAELSVVLTDADGTVLADEVFEPDYRTVTPNGDDCPPTCEQASVYLAWP